MKRNNKNILAVFAVLICMTPGWVGCNERNKKFEKIVVDMALIDSVKKGSDSSYSKPYYTGHFATAAYYFNKEDSTVMQVMKDSSEQVRQVIIAKNDKRIHFMQYYENGQLTASYHFNADGQNDGESNEYFENGAISMSGAYKNGLRIGKWKNFNEKGDYLFTAIYNNNGQQVATEQE